MCSHVRLEDGRYIHSVRELVALVGREAVERAIDPEHYPDFTPEDRSCLCPVDLEAVAAAAGYEEVEHDDDPMMHVWRKRAAAEPAGGGER